MFNIPRTATALRIIQCTINTWRRFNSISPHYIVFHGPFYNFSSHLQLSYLVFFQAHNFFPLRAFLQRGFSQSSTWLLSMPLNASVIYDSLTIASCNERLCACGASQLSYSRLRTACELDSTHARGMRIAHCLAIARHCAKFGRTTQARREMWFSSRIGNGYKNSRTNAKLAEFIFNACQSTTTGALWQRA